MSQSSGYSGRLADRTGVDAGPRWENAVGLVALERASWLGVLERQAEWLSLPLKGAAHGGMTGSSLTTIAGSTAALKWDPPLIQLRDWLSNYRLSIIILFLFFSFFNLVEGGSCRAGKWEWRVCEQQKQPATLHVCRERNHFLSSPIWRLLGPRSVWTPFVVMGGQTPWYVERNACLLVG